MTSRAFLSRQRFFASMQYGCRLAGRGRAVRSLTRCGALGRCAAERGRALRWARRNLRGPPPQRRRALVLSSPRDARGWSGALSCALSPDLPALAERRCARGERRLRLQVLVGIGDSKTRVLPGFLDPRRVSVFL